ncbi:hypothetical protein M0804_002313 [Polistes exclamans]|nr:hypothetical protein M0804_002313 [Polistes exclamans]
MADNKEEISELIDKRGTYKAKSLSLNAMTRKGGAYDRQGSHGCFPVCDGLCESYERIHAICRSCSSPESACRNR